MVHFLLKNRRYLRFWTATWFSTLAFWIRNMVLIFIVLDLSHNSSQALSINMVCEYAPTLIAPVLGVLADRWERKQTFIWGLVARTIFIGVIALGVNSQSLWLVYLGTFAGSVVAVLMASSEMAFVSEIVKEEDRKTATSLEQMVGSTMMLIGPPIGAGVFGLFGGIPSLWICAGLYGITLILIASIRMHRDAAVNEQFAALGFLDDLRKGFSYSKQHSVMKVLLVAAGFMGLGAGIVAVLEVFVVTEFLHLPKTMLSVLLAVQGAAMLVSVPIVNRLKISPVRMLPLGLAMGGISFFLMVAYPNLIVTIAGYLIMSLASMALNISIPTILRTDVEVAYQGRCTALFYTSQSGIMAIMTMATGWLHGFMSVQSLIFISGGATLLGGVLLYSLIGRWIKPEQEQHIPTGITSAIDNV